MGVGSSNCRRTEIIAIKEKEKFLPLGQDAIIPPTALFDVVFDDGLQDELEIEHGSEPPTCILNRKGVGSFTECTHMPDI